MPNNIARNPFLKLVSYTDLNVLKCPVQRDFFEFWEHENFSDVMIRTTLLLTLENAKF